MSFEMNDTHKKALLVFGLGFLIFALMKKAEEKKQKKRIKESDTSFASFVPEPGAREKVPNPKLDPKDAAKSPKAQNALLALRAYISAYNAKEPKNVLEDLNKELKKEYGLKVRRKSDGVFAVYDNSGKEIMSNS